MSCATERAASHAVDWCRDLSGVTLGELFPEDGATIGPYAGVRPAEAVEYFRRRFADSLLDLPAEGVPRFLDAGAGLGWLSLAVAMDRRFHVVAVDRQLGRMRLLQKLARVYGLEARVHVVVADLEALPFRDGTFSHGACVETLEHVGEGESRRAARRRQNRALRELKRVTRRWLLISTPNRWFPWVSHDVSLPLAHWLPFGLRRLYARWFRRGDRLARVHFLSPFQVERVLGRPHPETQFLNFKSPAQWRAIFPIRSPYLPDPGGLIDRRGSLLDWWARGVFTVFRSKSRFFLHSLSAIYDLAKAGGGGGESEG